MQKRESMFIKHATILCYYYHCILCIHIICNTHTLEGGSGVCTSKLNICTKIFQLMCGSVMVDWIRLNGKSVNFEYTCTIRFIILTANIKWLMVFNLL